MAKKNVLVFIFDGFADWETSYATVGIVKSNGYTVKTIAIDKTIKKSMGGLSIVPDLDFLPDVDLNDIDHSNTAMLILPGGVAWEENMSQEVSLLVLHCINMGIPVAAICGATLLLGDMGLLDTLKHTSNSRDYLKSLPGYTGSDFYQDKPSVNDGNIITAGGTASVEFAENIFEVLDIENHPQTRQWFQYFERTLV